MTEFVEQEPTGLVHHTQYEFQRVSVELLALATRGESEQAEGERLRALRCSAPFATVVQSWPCRQLWEKTAIDCAAVGCERLHTEVFRAGSLVQVVAKCERFFAIMPPVESKRPSMRPPRSSRLSFPYWGRNSLPFGHTVFDLASQPFGKRACWSESFLEGVWLVPHVTAVPARSLEITVYPCPTSPLFWGRVEAPYAAFARKPRAERRRPLPARE